MPVPPRPPSRSLSPLFFKSPSPLQVPQTLFPPSPFPFKLPMFPSTHVYTAATVTVLPLGRIHCRELAHRLWRTRLHEYDNSLVTRWHRRLAGWHVPRAAGGTLPAKLRDSRSY
eukprot:g1612.t1